MAKFQIDDIVRANTPAYIKIKVTKSYATPLLQSFMGIIIDTDGDPYYVREEEESWAESAFELFYRPAKMEDLLTALDKLERKL